MEPGIFTKCGLVIFASLLAATACKKGPSPAPANANQATEEFVPLPGDIRCSLPGLSFAFTYETASSEKMNGSVKGVTCWIAGKSPERKKEISLASNDITGGLLPTKDHGNLLFTAPQSSRTSLTIAIGADHLRSFTAFLQE
jgi:hypothetical protein